MISGPVSIRHLLLSVMDNDKMSLLQLYGNSGYAHQSCGFWTGPVRAPRSDCMNAHAPGWTCIGFATTIVVMLMGAVASAQFVSPTYPPPEFDPPISVTFDTGPFAPIAEIPPWSSITFQGFNVIYHVPNNPTGLVYFFHGGGGNAGIVRRVDITDILNELIASGFGFVSTSSTDRVANEWDHEPVTTNLDFLRMLDLRNALIANTEIETNSPLYAFGFSNGGSFSYTFSHLMSEMGLPISALATYESPGGQYALADPTIVQAPAFFVAAPALRSPARSVARRLASSLL